MTYVYLVLAIAFEVGWAIGIKVNRGFAAPLRPLPVGVTVVMYFLSFAFLALAARRMEIGTVYALWTGAGAALIAGIGILYYHEPASALKVVSLLLVIAGITGLNLAGGGHAAPAPAVPAQSR
jgi:quaternary ammonium compound-resistance protein SugE